MYNLTKHGNINKTRLISCIQHQTLSRNVKKKCAKYNLVVNKIPVHLSRSNLSMVLSPMDNLRRETKFKSD